MVDGKLYMVYDRWAGDSPGELIVEARRTSNGGLLARRGLGTSGIVTYRCVMVDDTLYIWA
ncbi:hypothetical protein [Hyperthermus butylicus]|uniref:hypothetical protein n=1 Tax=Hyperthermus butylicus TaxID=54248 RepID=UPI0003237D85|nr:hypothetical protein [Hyperthermus butylicus]